MEILSPAGSPEGLIASIKAGCDAVYLGGKSFGARAFADNFDDGQLEGAVDLAHDNGVKVNVTVNTLIKDSEMEEAVSFVKFLRDIGADAVIIQDLGLLKHIKSIDIAIHASTQMGIHSRKGLEWCAENGIDRAILARELTLDEIRTVVKDSPVETEVFIQGALCYWMSGGCLFSSLLGARSGNRGECAQPCRKRYRCAEGEGYLFSTGDIYGVGYMDALSDMGITSVKIEGRMRSPAYAYLSTKTYVLARDHGDPEEMKETSDLLKTVFNRGICDGYLGGIVSPVQSTYPDNRGYFIGRVDIKDRRFDTDGLGLNINDGISVFSGDKKIGGFKIGEGCNAVSPFPIKDGTYEVYRTYDPRIDTVKNLIGHAPRLNGNTFRRPVFMKRAVADRNRGHPELSFYVSSGKVLDEVLPFADRVYFDYGSKLQDAQEACDAAGVECVTNLPRITVDDLAPGDGRPVMVHGPGQYQANRANTVYGSYFCNAFNPWFPLPVKQVTASVELSKGELRGLLASYRGNMEVMAFGRIELAVTRDPGMTSRTVTDEKDYTFPIYRDEFGLSHILNSADLVLLDRLGEIDAMGADSIGIDLRRRPASLAKIVAPAYADRDVSKKPKITEMCGASTNGHYMRGV